MKTKTKTKSAPKLIDTARAIGIGKRTLQSWLELGCPNGSPAEIMAWRENTRELEPERGRRERGLATPLTPEQAFTKLLAAIRGRKDEICYEIHEPSANDAAWDSLNAALRQFIAALQEQINEPEDDEGDEPADE